MAKTKDIKLSELPEEVTADGLKIYGPTSYETQVAILSHYLHTLDNKHDMASGEKRYEILGAIHDYIEFKKQNDKTKEWKNVDEEELATMVAEGSPLQYELFSDFFNVPFPAPKNPKFTFTDLFAGMGGFRLAMQAQGGKCVFSSEWNAYSQETYFSNFGDMPFGDITKEVTKSYIPKKFDVLCAGFPCQPFSIAGVSKKKSLGRETGFKDKTQGTLFFDVTDIISRHRPKAFFLENVKNLTSHDKGNTFRVICDTLKELRYSIHYLVMDGQKYVPQHRERIMIVGFDEDVYVGKETFTFPEQHEATRSVKEILDPNIDPMYQIAA